MLSFHHRQAAFASRSGGGGGVRRLRAADAAQAFSKNLSCLMPSRPLEELQRRHSFDRDLLSLKLRRGRACSQHELCSADNCGLHIFDGVLTAAEASELIAHGQGVLDAEGRRASDGRAKYRRVDFMRSAVNGSASGHLLTLRVAERMRRISAEAFGLPLSRVSVAETLLALRTFEEPTTIPAEADADDNDGDGKIQGVASSSPNHRAVVGAASGAASLADRGSSRWAEEALRDADDSRASESSYHCDESLAPHFHFSTVLWLNDMGASFDGGELAFLHNRSWAWLVVEPRAGRAAVFSSGWENIHGIKPLRSFGARWALSVPLMVNDELQGGRSAAVAEQSAASGVDVAEAEAESAAVLGRRFHETCVQPADKFAYQHCRADWIRFMTPTSSGT